MTSENFTLMDDEEHLINEVVVQALGT